MVEDDKYYAVSSILGEGEVVGQIAHVTQCLKAAIGWPPCGGGLTCKYESLLLAKRFSISFSACLRSPASMALHMGNCW